MVTLEQLLDKIATSLIENINKYAPEGEEKETLLANQHTIKNGIMQSTRAYDEKLILWQKDEKANQQDIVAVNPDLDETALNSSLTSFVSGAGDIDISSVEVSVGDGGNGTATVALIVDAVTYDITGLLTQGGGNPLNISQFISLHNIQTSVNPYAALEHLDSTIYELLPDTPTRQERIDKFFKEYNVLKGELPAWYETNESEFNPPEEYEEQHDISSIQDFPSDALISEDDSFITRLNVDANTDNSGKTLQSLRDDLTEYLKDIDEVLVADPEDGRPDYENKQDGYLKIRNLNQGIVVRKQEGTGVGLEDLISLPDPTTGPLGDQGHHPHEGKTGPSYLMNGFTITMWVKFLDKTSRGTLFNYGNPLRGLDPKGFVLETYVLNKDDYLPASNNSMTWGDAAEGTTIFSDGDSERFIRLVVRDHLSTTHNSLGHLYDSRVGIPGLPKEDSTVPNFGTSAGSYSYTDYIIGYEKNLLGHQRVPIDFKEWYFVVANYNPIVKDNQDTHNTLFQETSDYWRGNILPTESDPDGTINYSHYSGQGSKCKVEIISRSDLLRARGYKT